MGQRPREQSKCCLLPVSGLEFPWGPKPFREVIAGPLLRNNGQSLESSSLEGSHVGVYFSAHWVSVCTSGVRTEGERCPHQTSCGWLLEARLRRCSFPAPVYSPAPRVVLACRTRFLVYCSKKMISFDCSERAFPLARSDEASNGL